jgi:hypothetical protein
LQRYGPKSNQQQLLFWPSLKKDFTEHSACSKKPKSIEIVIKMIKNSMFASSLTIHMGSLSVKILAQNSHAWATLI